MRDSDPLKCPTCKRRMRHVGWKKREGTQIEDWNHYEHAIWECRSCRIWWKDMLDGSGLLQTKGGGGKKKGRNDRG